jgi:tetratricopeptide (TPR) repeat protein
MTTNQLTSEDAKLDNAIRKGDELFVSSVKREESQRRRQRTILFVSILACVVGTSVIMNLVLWVVVILPRQAPQTKTDVSFKDEATKLQTADALTSDGWRLWQGGQTYSAVTLFQRALELNPKSEPALNGLGWANFNSGNPTAAEKAFLRLIEINPDHPAALNGLGQIYLVQGKLDKSEQFLKKAAPEAPAAWWGLTKVYLLKGDYAQAEQWAQKVFDAGDKTIQPLLDAAKAKKLDDKMREEMTPLKKE